MGYGDELLATSLARGAASRGRRAAFGDGCRIIYSAQSFQIFENNPHVARPGDEKAPDLEWIPHYRGSRLYGRVVRDHWKFRDMTWEPGEVYLTKQEKAFALAHVWGSDPIAIVEPRTKPIGATAGVNKSWGVHKYQELASRLLAATGCHPVQLVPAGFDPLLEDVDIITTPSFRHALAILGLSQIFIGPEGGLMHGAAAMDVPGAVIVYGGFNGPRSTGYPRFDNITAGGEPCGTIAACPHCAAAMASISVDRVLEGAVRQVGQRKAA